MSAMTSKSIIHARDLRHGDMLDGERVLRMLMSRGADIYPIALMQAKFELWTVDEVERESDDVIVIHTLFSGSWAVPSDMLVSLEGAWHEC